MGGREGGEGWRTPRRTGGQTRSRRVSGAGSVRCGRRGCAAAEVLCCSAVPGTAGVSRRSPAERRAPSTAARGPSPPPARPLTPRPRRSKLPKTSAAARPAAPGLITRRWRRPATAAMSFSSSTTRGSGVSSAIAALLSTTFTSRHTKRSWLPAAPILECSS